MYKDPKDITLSPRQCSLLENRWVIDEVGREVGSLADETCEHCC